MFFLTFDDGPDPNFTPRVLDVLASVGMRATFFVIGREALRQPELVRRAVREGHAIGNHSFSHRHPWTMRTRVARAEVRDGAVAIADVLGEMPRFFRPPHGRRRACMSDEATDLGERIVPWDLSAIDWGPFGRAERIAARLRRIAAQDVVLMHDGENRHNKPSELLKVLPTVLADLKARGMQSHALRA